MGPLSGATTPGQSGPGSDDNIEVLHIPQSSNITGTSPSDCLVSYPGHSLWGCLTLLQSCSRCILQPQPTGQRFLGYWFNQVAVNERTTTENILKVFFPAIENHMLFILWSIWLSEERTGEVLPSFGSYIFLNSS